MNIEDITLKQVKYKIENIVVYSGSTTFEVDSSMYSNLYIEKDYENMALPFVQLSLNLPNWLYRQMKKDPTNNRVGFTLKYGLFGDKEISGVPMTTELSGKFYALIPESGAEANEDMSIQIEKANSAYETGYTYSQQAVVDLLLVNEMYYKNIKKTCNQVFSSCTVADALTYVLNEGGYSNILLSPPNNTTRYSQFKITPIPLIKQIKRLCYEYSLHSNGSIIFFDLDRGYIVDKQAKCTAYVTNEYMTTDLVSLATNSQNASEVGGFYINKQEKSYLVNITEGSFNFQNTSNASNTSSIQIIDTDSGSVSSVSTGTSGVSTTYVYSGGANSASQIAKSIAEEQCILTVTTSACILSALTPNKTYAVSIDNLKAKTANINGNYRITNLVCNFTAEGEYLKPLFSAEFRK